MRWQADPQGARALIHPHPLGGVARPFRSSRPRFGRAIVGLVVAALLVPSTAGGSAVRAPWGGMPRVGPASHAASQIIVNTLTDEKDGSCGDGDCSLRDAIQVASASDTIRFSVSGFIVLDLGQLTIDKDLIIAGPGADPFGDFVIISADGASRVLAIGAGARVTLSGVGVEDGVGDLGAGIHNLGALTVNRCSILGNYATTSGGGIYNAAGRTLMVIDSEIGDNGAATAGGGIDNRGVLVVSRSEIRDNAAESGDGGGIRNLGSVAVEASTISSNYATSYGGGIYNAVDHPVSVTASVISDNAADLGGGAIDNRGALLVAGSEIRDNAAESGNGGGIRNVGALTVEASSFAGNSASAFGGGIDNRGPAAVTNSSFFVNAAARGGGIANTNAASAVTNCTVTENHADAAGGGIYSSAPGNVAILKNTIVASSTGGGDCSGALAAANANNLSTDGSCAPGFTRVTAAQLALGDLTGETGYFPLEQGSAAIDAGTNSGCPATDQRDASRPQDGDGNGSAICDVGAYEFVRGRAYLPLASR